jgi:hypothetical protein
MAKGDLLDDHDPDTAIGPFVNKAYDACMEPASLGTWVKLIDAAKNWPLWIFFAISASLSIFIGVPYFQSLSSPAAVKWLDYLTLVAWVFTLALAAAHLIRFAHVYLAGADTRIKFVIAPVEHQCLWGVSKQVDGTFVTNISGHFLVTNRMTEPLYLMAAKIITPKITGEVLPGVLTVRAVDNHMHGTAYVSGHCIPAGHTLPVATTTLIRGTPNQKDGKMRAVLEISDTNAHKARVVVSLNCLMPQI